MLEVSCQNTSLERWDDEFSAVTRRINDGMLTPVGAILEVYACATLEECIAPIERLPHALAPASLILKEEIPILETLKPPKSHQALHDSYLHTLKLRLEAFELYITAVENKDDKLIQAANDAWLRTQKSQLKTQALVLEVLQMEEHFNPAVTWMTQFGMVTKAFNQIEAEIGPALEVFFWCQTSEECDTALKDLPAVLRPGQRKIPEILVELDTLEAPAQIDTCSKVQNTVSKSYQLRFESYDLLIRGAEQTDYHLLDRGLQGLTQSMEVLSEFISDYSDCMQSIRQEVDLYHSRAR